MAAKRARSATSARRRVVKRQVVLDNKYLHLRLDTERDADGREHTYIFGTGPEIVVVVPVWDDGTVTLLAQRRYGMRKRSVEAPGGHVDPGERPLAAAKRELREETGIVARRMTATLTFLPAVKLQQNFHAFVATGLREGPTDLDDDEDVRPLRLPLDEVCRRAVTESGFIVHGPSIVALLAAREALAARR